MKGMSNKEIAGHLHLGEQTVKNALFTLYQKLGIASRGELFHLVFPISTLTALRISRSGSRCAANRCHRRCRGARLGGSFRSRSRGRGTNRHA